MEVWPACRYPPRGESFILLEQTDEAQIGLARKYDRWAKVGLIFLAIGLTPTTQQFPLVSIVWLPSPDICYISPHDYGPPRRERFKAISDLHASSRSFE